MENPSNKPAKSDLLIGVLVLLAVFVSGFGAGSTSAREEMPEMKALYQQISDQVQRLEKLEKSVRSTNCQ